MACPVELTTAQGYDLQAGTNVLGHYLLTTLLLPALLAASEPGQKARVVTTSSIVHYYIDNFHFDWVVDGPTRRSVGTRDLYKNSKFVSLSRSVWSIPLMAFERETLCLLANWPDDMEIKSCRQLVILEICTPACAGTCPSGRSQSWYAIASLSKGWRLNQVHRTS